PEAEEQLPARLFGRRCDVQQAPETDQQDRNSEELEERVGQEADAGAATQREAGYEKGRTRDERYGRTRRRPSQRCHGPTNSGAWRGLRCSLRGLDWVQHQALRKRLLAISKPRPDYHADVSVARQAKWA